MPILPRENDHWPAGLFDPDSPLLRRSDWTWWCLYTLSRREKELMRRLAAWEIPHYGPMVPKRFRSPSGRLRTSHVPLFPNYVFLFGDTEMRQRAQSTNCVARWSDVPLPGELVDDLRQIRAAVDSGLPLTPEARLQAGDRVRVRTGPFRDCEGTVIRREGKTRLLLSVRYLAQGVSMEVDEGILAPL